MPLQGHYKIDNWEKMREQQKRGDDDYERRDLKIHCAPGLEHSEILLGSDPSRKFRSLVRLNGRSLYVSPTRNAEAIKNDPRGVGTIKRVEMDAGYVVIQKIVTLFQGEVNTDTSNAFGVIFASP